MKGNKNLEYLNIIKPILDNEKFSEIENIKHHDSNRLIHCSKVSYYSYLIAKALRLNKESVARAGLLHDFYYESISDLNKVSDKIKLYSYMHQSEAVENSKKFFDINKMEENIIITHMFPLSKKLPKYAESIVVSLVDKGVSVFEFSKKVNFKLTIYILFILDIVNKK